MAPLTVQPDRIASYTPQRFGHNPTFAPGQLNRSGIVFAGDYSPLPEITLNTAEATTGWSGTGAVSLDAVDFSQGSNSVQQSMSVQRGAANVFFQYTLGSVQDYSPYRFLLVDWRWNTSAGGVWMSGNWEFRVSSGTNLTTLANVHTRIPVSRATDSTWHTLNVRIDDPTQVQTFGFVMMSATGSATHALTLNMDNVRLMAMPSWLRGLETSDSAAVIIPPGWTEDTADPAYITPAEDGKYVFDMRDAIRVHSFRDGRKPVSLYLIDGTGATDVGWPLQQMFDSLQDGDILEFPPYKKYLTNENPSGAAQALSGTPGIHRKHNITVYWNNSAIHTTSATREQRLFSIMHGSSDIYMYDYRAHGYRTITFVPSSYWTTANDFTTSTSGDAILLDTIGEAVQSVSVSPEHLVGRFGRNVDMKHRMAITMSDTAQSNSDCEVYIATEPMTLTANRHTPAGSSATVFTASGGTFVTDGVRAGQYVRNLNDGSEGVIVSLTETTLTVLSLTGGVQNDFDQNDDIEVFEKVTPTVYSGGTLLESNTLTLTGSQVVYTLYWDTPALDRFFTYAVVRKITSAVNTISVHASEEYNRVRYTAAEDEGGGLWIADAQRVYIYRMHGESLSGDAWEVQSSSASDIYFYDCKSIANRRQGRSYTAGNNIHDYNTLVLFPARAALDLEAVGTGPEINNVEVINSIVDGQNNQEDGATGLTIAAALYTYIHKLTIRGLQQLKTSPSCSVQGIISGGAFGGGVFEDWYCAPGTGLVQVSGNDMVLRNITADGVYLSSTAARCIVDGFHSSATGDFDAIVRDSGTQNVIKGVTHAYSGATTATPGSTGVGPVDILTAVPVEGILLDIDPGAARQRFPNTYPAVDLGNRVPYGGWNLYKEKLYHVGAISGRSTQPPVYGGRNFNNDPASPVSCAAGTTVVNVAFPTRTSPGTIVNAGGWPDGVNRGTGALAAATTYYYLCEARLRDSGPFTAATEVSVLTGAGDNAVQFNLEGMQETDDLLTGFTILRGTATGVYTHRYDVIPSSTYPLGTNVKRSGVAPVDLGATLSTGAAAAGEAAGSRGWPTTVAVETGNVTLTANTHDNAVPSATLFEDANGDFINDGVRVGYLITASGGGSAVISAVTKSTITSAALSGANTWGIGETATVTKQWDGTVDESGYEADRNFAVLLYNFRLSSTGAVLGTWDWSSYTIDRWVGGFTVTFTNTPVNCTGYFDWAILR